MNKKKLAVAALLVGIVLLLILVVIGVLVVAIVSALLGQADSGIGQSIGKIFQTVWGYVVDLIKALWKQIIANPLQFITGGGN